MTEKKMMIEPRLQTPSPSAGGSRITTGGFSDDLPSEGVKRLSVFAGIGIGFWTFGFVMDRIADLTIRTPVDTWKATSIEFLGVLVSAALLLYARYSSHTLLMKVNVGIVTMILNAFLTSMLNSWVPPSPQMVHLSWTAVVVLVYAMSAPSTPLRTFAASIVAASMDPLGVWLAHLRGEPVPSALNTFVVFMPNYASAIVAVLSARALQRLSRQIRKAR